MAFRASSSGAKKTNWGLPVRGSRPTTAASELRALELFGFFIVFGLSVTVKATSNVYAPCKAVLGCRAH